MRLIWTAESIDVIWKLFRPSCQYCSTRNYTITSLLYAYKMSQQDALFSINLFQLREERRLRVFENRVLRRVFGPKRDEVTGEWRILHSDELSDL